MFRVSHRIRISGPERRRHVGWWSAPRRCSLPTKVAVRDYLIGKGVERPVAESEAETVAVPLPVTKRGALAFARKL
jgi:hypothetical protein